MHGPAVLTICDETSPTALQNKQQARLEGLARQFRDICICHMEMSRSQIGAIDCSTPPPEGSRLRLYAELWQRALDVQKKGKLNKRGP